MPPTPAKPGSNTAAPDAKSAVDSLYDFLRGADSAAESTNRLAGGLQIASDAVNATGTGAAAAGASLLGFVRSVESVLVNTNKLTGTLGSTTQAVKTLDTSISTLTRLIQIPLLSAFNAIGESVLGIVSGAGAVVSSYANMAASIGSAPAAIMAAGLALSYATDSYIPAVGAVGLAVEKLGHNLGGFAGEVTFAAGAAITATAAFAVAGVAWRRAFEQILGPPLTAAVAGVTALGAVVGAASEVIRNHFVASMIALSPIVIPLGAAVLAWKAVLEPVAQVLLPRLQTGFEAVSAALGKAADAVGRVAGGAFNKLGELLQPAWDGVKAGIEKVKPYLAAGANYIKESLGKVGTALAATGGAIATGIRAALAADEIKNSIYRGFQAVVGGIAGALRGISESAASYLQAPFQVLDTAIGAVSANVGRFVQLAQPGVMVQFQRAVNDLYATIGHALAPVLQTATRFFRSIGSALNGLTSDGTRLIQALAGGTAALVAFAAGVALVEAVATGGLAPLVEILVGGLTAGFAAAVTASGALDSMMDSFASTLGGVMNAVGAAFVSLEPLGKMVMGIIGDIGSMFAGAVAKVAQMISGSGIFGELAEIGKEVYDALRPVIEALFQVQGAIAGAELKFIKHAIELAGPALVLFARVIGEVASTVMYWTKSLLSLFVEVPDLSAPRSELRNNTGAAAGQVQTSTPSELLRRAMEATFGAGRANGRTDFASETAKNTSEIAAKADAIQKAITDELPKKVVEMIGVAAGIALKTAFGAGASSVSGAVGGAANTARDVAAGGGAGTGLQIAAIIDQHLRISDRLLSTFGFGHG